jgi:hypothetical protein
MCARAMACWPFSQKRVPRLLAAWLLTSLVAITSVRCHSCSLFGVPKHDWCPAGRRLGASPAFQIFRPPGPALGGLVRAAGILRNISQKISKIFWKMFHRTPAARMNPPRAGPAGRILKNGQHPTYGLPARFVVCVHGMGTRRVIWTLTVLPFQQCRNGILTMVSVFRCHTLGRGNKSTGLTANY